jgi:hypothetical protein
MLMQTFDGFVRETFAAQIRELMAAHNAGAKAREELNKLTGTAIGWSGEVFTFEQRMTGEVMTVVDGYRKWLADPNRR